MRLKLPITACTLLLAAVALAPNVSARKGSDPLKAAVKAHKASRAAAKQGKPGKARKLCLKAVRYYRRVIRLAPSKVKLWRVTYQMADCLMTARRFRRAADSFRRLRKRFIVKAGFAPKILHGEILALDQMIKRLCRKRRLRRGCGGIEQAPEIPRGRQSMPRIVRRRALAREQFVVRYPSEKQTLWHAFLLGRTMCAFGRVGQSRRWLWQVASRKPRTAVGRSAGALILKGYAVHMDAPGIGRAAARLRRLGVSIPSMMHADLAATWHRARKAVRQGKHLEGAGLYLAVAARDPKGRYAPSALWNGAVAYIKAGKIGRSRTVLIDLIRRYPNSKRVPGALFILARGDERMLAVRRAAARYEKLITEYLSFSRRRDATLRGIRMYELLHDFEKAARLAQLFHRTWRGSPRAPKLLYRAGDWLARARDWEGVVKTMRRFYLLYSRNSRYNGRVVMAAVRWAKAMEAMKSPWPRTSRVYFRALRTYRPRSRGLSAYERSLGRQAAAEATFRLAEVVESTAPKGAAGLDRIEQAFRKVIPYRDGPWTICASYRIAMASLARGGERARTLSLLREAEGYARRFKLLGGCRPKIRRALFRLDPKGNPRRLRR